MFKLNKTNIKKLQQHLIPTLDNLNTNEIASIIQQANKAYYLSTPLISDSLYDLILHYLEEKDQNHPILKSVGAVVKDNKVTLPHYLGSLNKIKENEKTITSFTSSYPSSKYLVNDKLDGNSALLYINDKVTKLYTRGDGKIGQDITHLLPFIRKVPDKINQDIAVRGELIIPKAIYNETLKKRGPNARNIVAGILNAKIPDLSIASTINFVAYELVDETSSPEEQQKHLQKLGFTVAYYTFLTDLTVEKLSNLLLKRREESPYEIDGIVVTQNIPHKHPVNKNPEYAFAFKTIVLSDKAEVTVTNIEWNLSKDGIFIPVVLFNAVSLAGVTIQRATGFNGKFIKDNKIGPGSKLVVIRSGLVIPYISEILTQSESGEPMMPNEPFIWSKTGVDVIIQDVNNEVIYKNFENYFVKIEIPGLSSRTLRKLYDAGYNTIQKVLEMSIQDFMKVPTFKEKLSENLYKAIQESKPDYITVMEASNIIGRGFGKKKLELILNEYPDIMKNNYIPTKEQLLALKGIQEKTATLFIENLPKFFDFLETNNLKQKTYQPDILHQRNNQFENQTFVFTGLRNKDLEVYITRNGGKVTGSVGMKTTAVICKNIDEASHKIKLAQKNNIPIYTLEEFTKKYNIN